MKPIHFIDHERAHQQRFPLPWLIFTLFLTLVTALTIGSLHFDARHTFYKIQKKAFKLSQQEATISSLKQDLAELACQKKDIKQTIKKLKKKYLNNEHTLKILNDIAQAIPRDLLLTNVSITKASTTLEGNAHYQKSIQKLLDICGQTDWCSRTNLEIIPTQQNELILFKLILSHIPTLDSRGHY